ncbi:MULTISPECIES: cell surface protein SprA [Empedobacter]|uniref:T9SS outer membrane translocon Sov/SprA n=1 Tax=Empedobacter TaxID=59734 RepID=UPI0024498690|nr:MULTISPECIES: cell surface protein SprA [Empedobacter]MDH1882946.1 cell surface protein SprA [Empedobacter sp. GD03797]MDM1040779.1 cell surface protein SprA [Empedobacter brevis]MDM1134360.1 cell surface protein SprA [Empedobacter sp. R750]
MKIHNEPKTIRKGSTIAALCFLFAMGTMSDVMAQESDTLKFPIRDQKGGLFLDNQIKYDVQYDAIKRQYILYPQIGTSLVSEPIYLTRQEYLTLVQNQDMKNYFRVKSQTNDQYYREERFGDKEGKKEGSILPSFKVKSKAFETIFGGSEISLIPQGYANLELGVFLQKIDNPMLLPQNRQTLTMDLNQRMQLSILGKVGENLQMKVNYDTQAGFGFENQMKLQWRKALGNKLDPFGGEDDILQNIEVGNISMPLSTSLITGAQSLFGVRTDLKFGRTNVSAVFSEQRSESKNIVVQGGGVMTDFKVAAEKYEYNRHFFLGQFFRDRYDKALENYPAINSNINISNIEVWKVDKSGGNQQNRRAIIALRDIAEGDTAPQNGNNKLYEEILDKKFTKISDARSFLNTHEFNGEQFQDGENFIVNENVRKLDASEFTFYPKLGYISLNTPLVDGEDLLAVSFQYSLSSDPTKLYKVGQMSSETDKPIIAKLIKPNSAVNVASPMWDLMMKNIYSLNAYGVSSEDFLMNINFKDNGKESSGTLNYLPNSAVSEQSLLQVLNMDRLNSNGQLQQNPDGSKGDGLFDFQSGLTIDTERGNIIFTSVEPFGKYLSNKLQGQNQEYVFNQIYRQLPNTLSGEKLANRYTLEGRYKGTVTDGIPLGAFNVPQGSVKVTSGGATLTEGVDYTVDYQLGRVKIINEQLKNSGAPINVSLENQSTFNLQKKRFMGINVEHKFSDKLMLGGTLINYQERPVTQKTQFGSEPVNNTIFGLNTQYNSEAEWLTRLTNKIPGIKTDQMSNISVQAEAAYLMPGMNKVTGGYSYIDDFEDAQSRISLLDVGSWKFGSTPGKPAGYSASGYHPFFPNGMKNDDLSFNNGRRMLSWYTIDPRFYGMGGSSPLTDQQMSTHMARRIKLKELFDQRDVMAGTNSYISTLDMTFYPQERGPYNVNPNAVDTKNWGAIMRPISVSNFKDSNVEYIEFWMMDPYADGKGGEGELLVHLGNVSEDVLKDGEMMYENGLPHSNNGVQVVESKWGKTPQLNPILYAFDTDGAARKQQDLGYNGLTDEEEAQRYGITSNNLVTGELDPANDNYLFFLDDRFRGASIGNTVQDRYRYFRNPQGNNSTDNPLHASSLTPDTEDINGDFNLDQTENYNQYTLKINRQTLEDPNNKFIVARKTVQGEFPDKTKHDVKWYQVRIPVDNFDLDLDGDGVEELNNDASIAQAESVLTAARFMRMVMRGFEEETTIRFGTFDLVRSEWRRYTKNVYPLMAAGNQEGTEEDKNIDDLEVGEVSIERNGTDRPRYMIPPGVYREQTQGATGIQSQNEASMTLKAKFKLGSTSKAIFKNTNLDLRRYKKLQMFVSAQNLLDRASNAIDNGTKLFIRVGSDYTDNYYEYEMPLKYTPQSSATESTVWPDENFIDLNTDLFTDAKKQRDAIDFNTLQRFNFAFDQENPNKTIYVKGRPTLGNVSSIMIGVRNTSGPTDKEVLLWVNELRLSEIDNQGGYAASANVQFNLGDFANVQVSGSTSSVGFGAIDQGPANRNQDESLQYALNAQVKLDKFLPKKWGMEIPFDFTIQESFVDPKYNPLDNDIIFDEAPNKAELEKVVRTYTQFKSFAFNNIRKVRSTNNNNPVRFYDPSNFSVSMMYSDNYYRDIYTQYNVNQQLRASINYNFGFRGKSYEPFKKWRAVQPKEESGKYLQFIREFNVNPLPTRFSFRTEIARTYSERQYRDISQYLGGGSSSSLIRPTYSNNFLFNWQYNLGFDLTKSLRLDLTSSTMTLNDGTTFQRADQDMIWQNMFTIGRPVQYDQQFQVNYKLPLKFFPYLNWMNVEAGFTSNYNWVATSTAYRNFEVDGRPVNLGNGTAQNSNSINLMGDLDFTKFYPEFKGYKRYDSILKGRRAEIDSLNTVYTNLFAKKRRTNKKSAYKFKHKFTAKDYGWMVLSSLKRANFTFNQTNGAVIPGLLYEPGFFGVDGKNGPSLGFVYGTQFDIKRQLVERGLIVGDELMTDAYQITKGSDFNGTALIEPIPDLRIDLSAKRTKDRRIYHSGFNLAVENPYIDELANLNISTVNIKTAFKDGDAIFEQFLTNTKTISERLAQKRGSGNKDGLGYYEGFNARSSDVLLPAFLAAVQGKDAGSSKLGYNRSIPVPNWRVTYTGLKSVPIINKYFDNVEISSSYNSTYTTTGIQSNPNFMLDTGIMGGGQVTGKDENGNYYTQNLYGAVTMIESFSPLIGVDLTFRNSMQLRAQYNRDRLLSLSTTNYTYTEDYGSEYIVGFGYIFKDFKMKIRYQGNQKTIKGDLNIRGDFSLRDNQTTIRKVIYNFDDVQNPNVPTSIYGDSQITGGQRIMTFKLTADYNVSKNLNLRFYWDQMMSKYKISTAFPISQIRAGFSATFTFGN